ncbi:MAG: 4-hydroxy-3-methylbut-2-enyl diphosphate reductase [Paludibacteraceae bacterium]|nr:4-hydroxy-3-methylbut-2-enyl diphosphate reductase [Paludibacteraceae bacterium]
MIQIEIDTQSGFCFGVINAIKKAEEELKKGETLYCLGDIVHNEKEVNRLKEMGMVIITHDEFKLLHHAKVLLRAHGEPPETYQLAAKNAITIIDATCPVVLKLQHKIKKRYLDESSNSQIVIFGKEGHAEVNGLVGQTRRNAIVIENEEDISKIDFSKHVRLFSQTTKSVQEFRTIAQKIKERLLPDCMLEFNDTICRQVENRIPNIRTFAAKHDLILFVSGKKSSNGKILFAECVKINRNSYFISEPDEINLDWLNQSVNSVGICGATSTPKWLMESVADKIKEMVK